MNAEMKRESLPASDETRQTTGASRVWLVSVLACWTAVALLFAALPGEFGDEEAFLAAGAYRVAALFAAGAVVYAISRTNGAGRVIWAILGSALLLRLVGSTGRTSSGLFDLSSPVLAPYDVAYILSYLLLFCVLLWLVDKTTTSITVVAALDSSAAMLSVGLLAWYFVVDPFFSQAGFEGWRAILIARSSGPVYDVGLLCLALVVASTDRRPSYAVPLAGAFTAFLIADGLYLGLRSPGSYEPGAWPELVWALGIALFGVAALRAVPSAGFSRQLAIRPWILFAFWFSPLSPAMHLAFLLMWGTLQPLPYYVLWVAALLVLYFAFRISVASYVNRQLQGKAVELAQRREQGRISEELHDSLKQSVYRTSLLLTAYRRTRERGSGEAAEKVLREAIEAAMEANYRVSRPIQELHTLCAPIEPDLPALLREPSKNLQEYFGIKLHEDLRADLSVLEPKELSAVQRIASEALWNAAKHSGAKNVWIESREVGRTVLVKVRDDGSGFSQDNPPTGSGLALMYKRAEEAGGALNVISKPPLGGATVQVRFDKE